MGHEVGQQRLSSEGRDESVGFCAGGSATGLGEMADQAGSVDRAMVGSLPLSFGRSSAPAASVPAAAFQKAFAALLWHGLYSFISTGPGPGKKGSLMHTAQL